MASSVSLTRLIKVYLQQCLPVPFTQLVDLQRLPLVQLVLLHWLHLVLSQLASVVELQWIPFTQLMMMAFSAPVFGALFSGS